MDEELKEVELVEGEPEQEVARAKEVRAWYVYDFANSPYFQIVTVFMPVLLALLSALIFVPPFKLDDHSNSFNNVFLLVVSCSAHWYHT